MGDDGSIVACLQKNGTGGGQPGWLRADMVQWCVHITTCHRDIQTKNQEPLLVVGRDGGMDGMGVQWPVHP